MSLLSVLRLIDKRKENGFRVSSGVTNKLVRTSINPSTNQMNKIKITDSKIKRKLKSNLNMLNFYCLKVIYATSVFNTTRRED